MFCKEHCAPGGATDVTVAVPARPLVNDPKAWTAIVDAGPNALGTPARAAVQAAARVNDPDAWAAVVDACLNTLATPGRAAVQAAARVDGAGVWAGASVDAGPGALAMTAGALTVDDADL